MTNQKLFTVTICGPKEILVPTNSWSVSGPLSDPEIFERKTKKLADFTYECKKTCEHAGEKLVRPNFGGSSNRNLEVTCTKEGELT